MKTSLLKILILCCLVCSLAFAFSCNKNKGDTTAETGSESQSLGCGHEYQNYFCTKCGEEYDSKLHYVLSADKTHYIVAGVGLSEDLDIYVPSQYKGKPIEEIAPYAFERAYITSFSGGNNLKAIGKRAFEYCSLTSVTIGNGVTSIGEGVFYNCASLTSVVLPDSVTSIGERAFYNCSSLTSVVLPNSVTSIGDGVFYHCIRLTSVVLPDSVTSIGEEAFYQCSSLISVTIGKGVTSIGEYVFRQCYKLVEVINKSSHITIEKGSALNGYVGYYALSVFNCDDTYIYISKLTNDNGCIVFTDGEEKILVSYIGGDTNLVIPEYITKINRYAFYSVNSLTSVIFNDTATWCAIRDDGGRITFTDLTDPSRNATWLTKEYYIWNWYKDYKLV